MKKLIAFLTTVLMIVPLFGCAGNLSSDVSMQEYSDDFTIAYLGCTSINPILSQSNLDHSILYLLELQLIRLYEGEIICDGAESYSVNEDYTQYTFTIRDGLTWSNGEALTAHDFEYGFYCLLAPEMGSPRAGSWFGIKNAEPFAAGSACWEDVGVKATDERTLVIDLEMPISDFDRTVALKHVYAVNKAFVALVGTDQLGASPNKLLYSGPYVLSSRESSDLVLEKNPMYWNSADSFPTERLHFVKVDDANTQVAMFESHELDVIQYVSSQYNDYLSDYLYKQPGGGIELVWLNENSPHSESARLMQNRNFRLALSNGFSRNDVTAASNTAYTPYNRIVDTGFVTGDGARFVDKYPVNTVPLEGNVDAAKEYLAKALDELGYQSPAEFPEMTMVTFSDENYKNECEMLIDQWRQNLGIDCISLIQYEAGQAIDTFYKADYDMFVISWEPNVRPTDIMVDLMTGGEGNPGTWSEPHFDELVRAATAELDPEKRAELTQEAEQTFLDDCSLIPIYILNSVSAVQSNVSGFRSGAIDGYEFDALRVANLK